MKKPQKNFDRHIKIKVVGVGGAGTNAVDRLVMEGFQDVNILSVNTDTQHLASSVASEKIQIGAQRTRGLGAGGDPKVGTEAALEDETELRAALTGYDLVFLAAGMGGGTGTGAGPVLAEIARQQGALVLALVTLPFSSEGKHRCRVAQEGLEVMRKAADAIICIPNDRLLSLAKSETSVLDAFRPTDQFLCDGVRMIYSMLVKTGLINIDFADLAAVLRREKGETLVGYGTAGGEKKIEMAVQAALASPLLSQSEILKRAEAALVCMTYSPATSMREVNEGMLKLQQQLGDNTAIKVGYVIDETINNEVSVLVIASTGKVSIVPVDIEPRQKSTGSKRKRVSTETKPEVETIETPAVASSFEELEEQEAASDEISSEEPDTELEETTAVSSQREIFLGHQAKPVSSVIRELKKTHKAETPKQDSLPLDESTHGMFDKYERVIVNGQDLDQPTYLRLGVRLQRVYR